MSEAQNNKKTSKQKSKSGKFSKKESKKIKFSVREDGHWTFIRKHLKVQQALLAKPITICELGSGNGDNAILTQRKLSHITKEFICLEGSIELYKRILDQKLKNTKTILQDVDKIIKYPKADVFLSKFVFHHLENKEEILKEIYKQLPKNGIIILIDKFPRFPIFITNLIEQHLDKKGIKKQLGNHHYTNLNKFLKAAKQTGFTIEEKIIKHQTKKTNFFIKKAYLVLRKN